jgi:hypothetical protein
VATTGVASLCLGAAACGGSSQQVEVRSTTTVRASTSTSSTSSTTTTSTTKVVPTTTAVPTTAPRTAAPTAPAGPAGPQPPAPPPPPSPAVVGGTWTPVSTSPSGTVLARAIRVSVGASSFVAVRVTKDARLKLYRGSDLGGPSAISPVDRANAILSFNGAFNPGDSGGITGFLGGPGTVANGMAAAVGYQDGGFDVGVWGRNLPAPGRSVHWARTNLFNLLVDGGQPTAATGDPGQWGTPLASIGMNTARSAMGVDGDGNLLYVASMATLPGPLAQVLVSVGAQRAMELDINPWWVCAFAYSGGGTNNLVQNGNRPSDVFSGGWNRDFFVATTS